MGSSVEKESDDSPAVPTVSTFKKLMTSGELFGKYDFGPLQPLASSFLQGSVSLENFSESLKEVSVPHRSRWRSLQKDILHRIATTRPSRRSAAAMLCLFLAGQWIVGKGDHYRRGINHAYLVALREKLKGTRETVVEYYAADHLSLRSDMTRSPRVDQKADFPADSIDDMGQMVSRMWTESILPDCESGYLPDFHIRY
jgi:hypothetical protein